MTRKPFPKVITRSSEDLRDIAASTVADEEAPAPPRNAIRAQPVSLVAPPPIAISPRPASVRDETQAVRRWSQARKIVERHRTYAALGGLFPLPIVNIAGVASIVLRMVKQLSDLYGVPFERERTRSLVISLMGGAVPTGLGAATASTLVFIVPGSGFVGLAVSAITAAALTRGIGLVFVDHFESGAMSLGEVEAEPA
jgi:uncharacterized protein (DUF697 family)